MTSKKYDIIGDIHGCADELEALLCKLGYTKTNSVYSHPEHQAVFLGDFIDRGPDQKRVLEIVRPMIEAGYALSVMGNHEFNAICYATEFEDSYVRPHTDKNYHQHEAFLDAYPHGSPEYQDVISWFMTLPVYLDLDDIGIVHACWDEQSFQEIAPFLDPDNTLRDDAYIEYADDASAFYAAIEKVLKGPEHSLPPELHFHDNDGHKRENARIRWWEGGHKPTSQRLEFACAKLTQSQKDLLDSGSIVQLFNLPAKPVFVGHYWLKGTPEALAEKIACVDYSVAKGGKMTSYRWCGENKIKSNNFVWV